MIPDPSSRSVSVMSCANRTCVRAGSARPPRHSTPSTKVVVPFLVFRVEREVLGATRFHGTAQRPCGVNSKFPSTRRGDTDPHRRAVSCSTPKKLRTVRAVCPPPDARAPETINRTGRLNRNSQTRMAESNRFPFGDLLFVRFNCPTFTAPAQSRASAPRHAAPGAAIVSAG